MISLMKLKKAELIEMIENEKQRADEQLDRAERLQDEIIEDTEKYKDDSMELAELKEWIEQYKTAKIRLDLGIMTEQEYCFKYLDKILEYAP